MYRQHILKEVQVLYLKTEPAQQSFQKNKQISFRFSFNRQELIAVQLLYYR